MKAIPLSPSGIFRDIVSMSWSLPLYIGKGKEYEPLLKFICEKKYKDSNDIPPMKELLKEIGLSYAKFTRLLKNLYTDLREDDDFVLDSLEVKYRIWATSSYADSVIFDIKNLPVVPRVGEKVEIPYFQEFLGRTSFYVKNVIHKLRNGSQCVEIEVAEGDYNLFWHLRLDEAIEREEIHWRELFDLTPSQLKDKLEVTPKWRRKSNS
jgi:hypothetical protein